jgi:hypothetical protein
MPWAASRAGKKNNAIRIENRRIAPTVVLFIMPLKMIVICLNWNCVLFIVCESSTGKLLA